MPKITLDPSADDGGRAAVHGGNGDADVSSTGGGGSSSSAVGGYTPYLAVGGGGDGGGGAAGGKYAQKAKVSVPIFRKISSTDDNERKWALKTLSQLIVDKKDGARVVQGVFDDVGVLDEIYVRLIDTDIAVREGAAGCVQNISIVSETACNQLAARDVLTALMNCIEMTVNEYFAKLEQQQQQGNGGADVAAAEGAEGAKDGANTDGSSGDGGVSESATLQLCFRVLSNVCEANNEVATKFVLGTSVWHNAVRLLSSALIDDELRVAVATFLCVACDSNAPFIEKVVSSRLSATLLELSQHTANVHLNALLSCVLLEVAVYDNVTHGGGGGSRARYTALLDDIATFLVKCVSFNCTEQLLYAESQLETIQTSRSEEFAGMPTELVKGARTAAQRTAAFDSERALRQWHASASAQKIALEMLTNLDEEALIALVLRYDLFSVVMTHCKITPQLYDVLAKYTDVTAALGCSIDVAVRISAASCSLIANLLPLMCEDPSSGAVYAYAKASLQTVWTFGIGVLLSRAKAVQTVARRAKQANRETGESVAKLCARYCGRSMLSQLSEAARVLAEVAAVMAAEGITALAPSVAQLRVVLSPIELDQPAYSIQAVRVIDAIGQLPAYTPIAHDLCVLLMRLLYDADLELSMTAMNAVIDLFAEPTHAKVIANNALVPAVAYYFNNRVVPLAVHVFGARAQANAAAELNVTPIAYTFAPEEQSVVLGLVQQAYHKGAAAGGGGGDGGGGGGNTGEIFVAHDVAQLHSDDEQLLAMLEETLINTRAYLDYKHAQLS